MNLPPSNSDLALQLVALHIYPVKSLAGTVPRQAVVEPWGLAADRRWLLARPDGSKVTQREQPRLARASAQPLPDGGVRLSAPGMEQLTVAVPDSAMGTVPVRLWASEVKAVPAAREAGEWFSGYLGEEVQLVHLDDTKRRPIRPDYSRPGETVSFADGFPLLVTTVSSLDALNSLIAQGDHADEGPLPMNRFRPNAVVQGFAPWGEDGWKRIRIGEVIFRVAKPCGRCVVTTTDQFSAERGKEPLRTLARYRRFSDQVVFGQYVIPETVGRVRVGDPVQVLD